jgi:hypothetical protein
MWSYLGFNFDTHSLVEPLLIDKIKNSYTWKQNVTDAGEIVKNKYGGTLYSDEYAKQLHDMNGMVEKQMRKAITVTASFGTRLG